MLPDVHARIEETEGRLMGGKGPAPNPDAKRRNKENEFQVVAWDGDGWQDMLDSGEVPEPPASCMWVEHAERGRRALAAWRSVWTGPLRSELLPQHMAELELLCDAIFWSEHGGDDCLKWVVQARLLGVGFAMNPDAVRRQRLRVERPRTPVAQEPPAVSSGSDRRRRALKAVKVEA